MRGARWGPCFSQGLRRVNQPSSWGISSLKRFLSSATRLLDALNCSIPHSGWELWSPGTPAGKHCPKTIGGCLGSPGHLCEEAPVRQDCQGRGHSGRSAISPPLGSPLALSEAKGPEFPPLCLPSVLPWACAEAQLVRKGLSLQRDHIMVKRVGFFLGG